MITRDDVVEARARAICCGKRCQAEEQNSRHASGKCTGRGSATGFIFKVPCNAVHCRKHAEATMQADDGLGLALVPYGATLVMQNAACSNFNKIAGLNAAIAAGNLLPKEKQDG